MHAIPAAILLQAGGQSEPQLFNMLFPMIAIFGIFYFLLIRPQQKKQKDQEAMIKGIQRGDSVVTTGGLHGKVTGVSDDVLTLEIAALKGERVRVKVARPRIESVSKGDAGEAS